MKHDTKLATLVMQLPIESRPYTLGYSICPDIPIIPSKKLSQGNDWFFKLTIGDRVVTYIGQNIDLGRIVVTTQTDVEDALTFASLVKYIRSQLDEEVMKPYITSQGNLNVPHHILKRPVLEYFDRLTLDNKDLFDGIITVVNLDNPTRVPRARPIIKRLAFLDY